ncbi:MAG TPA: arsinothricin resistance N-acetyltransferase ArsN1 family B [Rhodocyclaceae bacterium]|nr:arsinothricin resistance N-acetyltransferase ArsN1 family B [Rhodocyclaceae bacterium]
MIRDAEISDAQAIAGIYNYYVANTTISFEETPVSTEQIAERILEVRASSLPWFVAEDSGRVLGYAYASKWKTRSAYRFAVETSVYLQRDATGQGLGRQLYEALFHTLKVSGIHIAIGGIALPNEISIRLHEKLGMKKVAHFEQVGFKFGKWVDVAYWQKEL